MTRLEFMKELEELLSDIPSDEKAEAIQYYNNYLDDAGIEHEDEVLKELGSPSQVAAIIKADLNMDAREQINRGNFTETGYKDTVYTDEKFELEKKEQTAGGEQADTAGGCNSQEAGQTGQTGQEDGQETGSGSNGWTYGKAAGGTSAKGNDVSRIVLIVLLCIFAIPVGIPLFFSVFGVLFGVAAAIFALFIGLGIAGAVMICIGLSLIIIGLVNLGVSLAGLAFCGSGLVTFGLGIMFLIFSILLCSKILPAMIRGIVKLIRLPFENRRVAA